MCRNITPLFNFQPPATRQEVYDAAEQFVRKISGFRQPSQANEAAFNQAITEVAAATQKMLDSLVTQAKARNRKTEAAKAHARAISRFGKK